MVPPFQQFYVPIFWRFLQYSTCNPCKHSSYTANLQNLSNCEFKEKCGFSVATLIVQLRNMTSGMRYMGCVLLRINMSVSRACRDEYGTIINKKGFCYQIAVFQLIHKTSLYWQIEKDLQQIISDAIYRGTYKDGACAKLPFLLRAAYRTFVPLSGLQSDGGDPVALLKAIFYRYFPKSQYAFCLSKKTYVATPESSLGIILDDTAVFTRNERWVHLLVNPGIWPFGIGPGDLFKDTQRHSVEELYSIITEAIQATVAHNTHADDLYPKRYLLGGMFTWWDSVKLFGHCMAFVVCNNERFTIFNWGNTIRDTEINLSDDLGVSDTTKQIFGTAFGPNCHFSNINFIWDSTPPEMFDLMAENADELRWRYEKSKKQQSTRHIVHGKNTGAEKRSKPQRTYSDHTRKTKMVPPTTLEKVRAYLGL